MNYTEYRLSLKCGGSMLISVKGPPTNLTSAATMMWRKLQLVFLRQKHYYSDMGDREKRNKND